MSSLRPQADSAPQWFLTAVGNRGEQRSVEVAGADIAYQVWGPAEAPVVVLVHGGAAHGGWWDHLGPLLADGRRIAALDLSGHGSSASRDSYDFLTWADEVLAVARAEGSHRPFVVGHSMGGIVALTAAFRYAGQLAGVALIDLPPWVLHGRVPPNVNELPPRRHHETRSLAKSRFRATPDDPARLDYVVEHVADRSVRRTDLGWTWRFDHVVTTHGSFPDELWGTDRSQIVLILAERGLLEAGDVDELVRRLDGVETLAVPDSGHHIMLDQPLALAETLEEILASWSFAPENNHVP